MKKINIYIFIVFIYAAGMNAQNFMDSVRADIQNKIQHLDSDNVPTGILYDRTLPISNLPGYGS